MNALEKLSLLARKLRQSFESMEASNTAVSNRRMSSLFSNTLFKTEHRTPLGFLKCFEDNIKRAQSINVNSHPEHLHILVTQLSEQADALSRMSSGLSLIQKESAYKKDQRFPKSKYKKAAKAVVASSHELYQNLAQHHEWERQLQQKLNDQQVTALQANGDPTEIAKINALNERLKRCRSAIGVIEYQIQQTERSHG